MKLKILHLSLLFAATTAKDVYVEGATTDSPGAAAVVPAAKLGANESANYEYDEDAATDSPGAEAVVPAAKLNGVKNEALAANHRRMWDSYGPSCGIGISHCASECIDTDNGAVDVDPWNDACTDYIGNTHWCGNYDDDDFTSHTMCCACGGGAASTYAACEGTYVRPAGFDKLFGKAVWDRVGDTSRSIYYCGGAWRITSSQDREAYIRGDIATCRYFIKSAPTTTDHWYEADWSANNGAYSAFGQPCEESNSGGWTVKSDVPGGSVARGGVYCWHDLKDNHVDGCKRGTWGWLNGGCPICEGDCDRDSDCGDGLYCFQRDGFTPVPGCKGTGQNNWDYCVHKDCKLDIFGQLLDPLGMCGGRNW